MERKNGIAEAAREVPCPESTLRRLDRMGIVKAARDPWGRRLFSHADVLKVRAHLQKKQARSA